MQEKEKAKLFYTLMWLSGALIILLPVGIANLFLGYVLGDSPCSSCWGQRQSMMYIGALALFIARFGLKPKYIAMILIMTAFGLWQSFNHLAWHSGNDLDQGFSLLMFGLHSYVWAEIVFWSVIVILGVILLFAPKFSDLEGGRAEFTPPVKMAFFASIFVIASNAFQAFVSTGIPPYMGQGNPVRFSLNPDTIIWSADNWKKFFTSFSVLGKRDVKAPDYAFAPATKLGITFSNDSNSSPFASIDKALKIIGENKIEISVPLNSLNEIYGEYVASSKNDVFFLDQDLAITDFFRIDPYYSATIDPIVGVVPFLDKHYLLMGSNKTYLRFRKNDKADANLQYAEFLKGADRFEGQGDKGLGRGRFYTMRAKYHHALSIAGDGKYFYTTTAPNNKDKKTFVISAFLVSDLMLSREFVPSAKLKDGRSLGELYVTATTYFDGKLYALSKNYNVIAVIDPNQEKVLEVMSFPKEIKNARGLIVNKDGIKILSYQDGANTLFDLK